ncbi:MAG: signal peptidase I [Clostridia bacterium]|nr:signal peptidase I [Clostridia bacterium]
MDKVLRILRNAFCIIVAGLFVLIAVVTVCGAKGYSVASDSMNPELYKGYVVFVKETPFEELKKGDIVTAEFKVKDGTTYTHRIVSIDYDKKEIKTAGDKTGLVDTESATADQIKGKVWFSIPLLGYLSLWLTNANYVAVIAIFVLVIMAVSFAAGKFYKNKTRGDKNEHSEEKNN